MDKSKDYAKRMDAIATVCTSLPHERDADAQATTCLPVVSRIVTVAVLTAAQWTWHVQV